MLAFALTRHFYLDFVMPSVLCALLPSSAHALVHALTLQIYVATMRVVLLHEYDAPTPLPLCVCALPQPSTFPSSSSTWRALRQAGPFYQQAWPVPLVL